MFGFGQEKGKTDDLPDVLMVGDRMADGTIYAGISPDTDKPLYTTPADAPLTYTFNQAQEYAAALDAHGHHDWRVPTLAKIPLVAAAPLLSPLGAN
jgi:hypothetical protein